MRPEPSSRLRRLASRYALSGDQQQQLLGLLEVLERGGRAPTAVRDPDGAIDQHLADSLVALEVEALPSAGQIADIGSGAGFPGLPLAIALAGSTVSLVESQSRWAAFLSAAGTELGVPDAPVVHARIGGGRAGLAAYAAAVAP